MNGLKYDVIIIGGGPASSTAGYIDKADLKRKIKNTSIFYGFLNWGYSWVFIKNDKLIVGLGGLNRANKGNLLKSFQNLIDFLGINQKKISNIKGHPIPFGNFILKPVYENTVLVGDAAGLADPLTGEGIYYAQKSAELASFAIYQSLYNKKDFKTTYISLLKKHFFWNWLLRKILDGFYLAFLINQIIFL